MKLINFFVLLSIHFIISCGPQGITFTPPDPTDTIPSWIYVEYDYYPTANAQEYWPNNPGAFLSSVNKLFSKKYGHTGFEFFLNINDTLQLPPRDTINPEMQLFSSVQTQILKREMLYYAGCHRHPMNLIYQPGIPNYPMYPTYKYHLLSVDDNEANIGHLQTRCIGGYTLTLEGQPNTIPEDLFNRFCFIFTWDIEEFMAPFGSGYPIQDVQRFITYTTAHELGHHIAGLTHPGGNNYHESGATSFCVMTTEDNLSRSYFRNNYFLKDRARFCYIADGSGNINGGCVFYIRQNMHNSYLQTKNKIVKN